jgi:hypothetical protein
MAYWEFYHTVNNPTGLDGTVGGARTGDLVEGSLNELFAYVEAPPSGTTTEAFQYRKVHVRNASATTLTGVKLWLDAIEHTDQIYVGLEGAVDQTISSPTGSAPAGVSFTQPTSYTGGIDLGSVASTAASGLWLRQGLSGISEPDPYASFRVYVGGLE